jgi:Tfp pilus assembly protein PilF
MSVINSMLKDLERRGVECANSDDSILGGLSANNNAASASRERSQPYLVSLVSVILILVIIIAVYYLSPYQLVTVAQEKSVAQPTSADNLDTEVQTTYNNPVVVAQDKIPVDTPVVVQSAPEQNKIIADVAATGQAAQKQPEQPSLTSSLKVTGVHNKVVARQDDRDRNRQKNTPVTAQIKNSKPDNKQQKAAPAKTEDFDRPDRSTDALQVVNKKQRAFTKQEKSKQAYATALSLYNQGSRQSSKASLKEALNYDPSNLAARSLLAAIYLENGRTDLATEIIEKGLLIQSNDQKILRLYLQALVQGGNYQDAIVVMEQRLRLTSPEDLGYLAGLYQKSNDHLNAVKLYSRALQLKPSKSIWWMGQGISFEAMEEYNGALQSYQQSISTGQLSGKLTQYAINRINSIKQLNADSVT